MPTLVLASSKKTTACRLPKFTLVWLTPDTCVRAFFTVIGHTGQVVGCGCCRGPNRRHTADCPAITFGVWYRACSFGCSTAAFNVNPTQKNWFQRLLMNPWISICLKTVRAGQINLMQRLPVGETPKCPPGLAPLNQGYLAAPRTAEQHGYKPLLQFANCLALKIRVFQGALQSATWPVRLGYLTTTLT